jgi:hypothetical protein
MTPKANIYVTIPALDELVGLPALLGDLSGQSFPRSHFEVWVCVNQPERWWQDPVRRRICARNVETLSLLRGWKSLRVRVIDRCRPGRGWPAGMGGVGWARKTLMDQVCCEAGGDDIVCSLDADVRIPPKYLENVYSALEPGSRLRPVALVSPYYHPLVGNPELDRATLRYELYLRSYSINLWRIGSPYAFTALGSVLSFPVDSYLAVRGIAPRTAGEDFHFLMKLAKLGLVCRWTDEPVIPSPRPSPRVPFGTGPAVRWGRQGDWSRYPIFDPALFDRIQQTVSLFPALFHRPVETPLVDFFLYRFDTPDPFARLRSNHKTIDAFIRGCHQRFDALRIFQYLRYQTEKTRGEGACRSDAHRLAALIRKISHLAARCPQGPWDLARSETSRARIRALCTPDYRLADLPLSVLATARDLLAGIEAGYMKRHASRLTLRTTQCHRTSRRGPA